MNKSNFQVFESLNVKSSDNCETVILDSLSVYEYQHNLVTVNPPFIQSMFNSNYHHDKSEFSTMPQPNMIKGLSAAGIFSKNNCTLNLIYFVDLTDHVRNILNFFNWKLGYVS